MAGKFDFFELNDDERELADTPPYRSWNEIIAEEELDFEYSDPSDDEIISLSSEDEGIGEEEPVHIREEPADYEEWEPMSQEEEEEEEEEEEGEEEHGYGPQYQQYPQDPRYGPQYQQYPQDPRYGPQYQQCPQYEQYAQYQQYDGMGDEGQNPPEYPEGMQFEYEDKPPNTQYYSDWRAEVREVDNVRLAHIQLDLYSRVVLSRDQQLVPTHTTPTEEPWVENPPTPPYDQPSEPPEACSPERLQTPPPDDCSEMPPTPGRAEIPEVEIPEACSPGISLSPSPEPWDGSPPRTPGRTTPVPVNRDRPRTPQFNGDEPRTWPQELQDILADIEEQYLLGERTGRTRVKRKINGIRYQLRVHETGRPRADIV